MAVATWPIGVPYAPQRAPYALQQRHAALVATDMEDGPVRQRARSTAAWSQHAYQIRMRADQYAVFDDFLMRTLVQGAARFMMPVGRPGAALPWPSRLAYIERGEVTVRPEAIGFVMVTFTLNVLDW